MLFGIAAEDQDRQVRRARLDRRQRVDAALAGHRQVHHQHVDLGRAHEVDRLAAAGGFAHHAQVDLLGKELPQTGAHDGVVVDNGDLIMVQCRRCV